MGEVLPLDEVLRALLGDQGLDGVDVLLLQHGLDQRLQGEGTLKDESIVSYSHLGLMVL